MYSTTGLPGERVVDLCAMIRSETMNGKRPWPPILGLFRSVTVALTYMRRNRVQAGNQSRPLLICGVLVLASAL